MKSYDEIVGFDYTSRDEWKKWIEEKFLPLYEQLSMVLMLKNYLESTLKADFKEVFNQRYIKEILLGGVTKEGEYRSDSLAKFYKDTLGISVNSKEWIACCKAGVDPTECSIECRFENTIFLTFVDRMRRLVEKTLYKVEIEPQMPEDREIEELVRSPERLSEVVREVYKAIVSISANHDYHMFFILNTRCIPRFFIEKAYPKLKEHFEEVAEVLGLEEKFVPNIGDEKIKEGYTLIGHREGELADILFRIQRLLWLYLDFDRGSFFDGNEWIDPKELKEIFSRVVSPKNLWLEFREKVGEIIAFPKELKVGTAKMSIVGYNSTLYFVVRGALIIKVFNGYSPRTTYAFYNKRLSISFMEFMEKISPYIFMGVFLIEPTEKIPYPEVLYGTESYDAILRFVNLLEG